MEQAEWKILPHGDRSDRERKGQKWKDIVQ